MQSKLLLALASLAPAALAAPSKGKFGCAAEPPASVLMNAAEMSIKEQSGRFTTKAAINVDVYFHVVSASDSEADGNVPDEKLDEQFKVMNAAYAPHDISFTLKGTDRTVDATWAVDGDEDAMKSKLRQGSYSALNLYFLKEVGGAFGYCYFPDAVVNGSADFTRDGCSILSSTVPGGSETNYNEGHTVTHEVGHWFGLFHTFQGSSCTGAGDQINDTPTQLSPTSGCPVNRDSCPNADGLDPVHNYMDYSYDSCYEEFTPGQDTRMHSMFTQYREGK